MMEVHEGNVQVPTLKTDGGEALWSFRLEVSGKALAGPEPGSCALLGRQANK